MVKQQKQAPVKVPAKSASAKPVTTGTTASSAVSIVGAPELIVQTASDKGVKCVLRNVRLTWVFVTKYRPDKDDWTKGVKSVTALIPKKSAQAFQRTLAEAVKQTIALNKKVVDMTERREIFATALAVDVERSLLKDGDNSVDQNNNPREELAGSFTWQIKKNGYRESKTEDFAEPFPLTFHNSLGKPVEAAFVDKEFYSGVYADVALTLATFDTKGNKGVTAFLNGLRKVRDGARIGGFDPFAGVPPAGNEIPEAAAVDFL